MKEEIVRRMRCVIIQFYEWNGMKEEAHKSDSFLVSSCFILSEGILSAWEAAEETIKTSQWCWTAQEHQQKIQWEMEKKVPLNINNFALTLITSSRSRYFLITAVPIPFYFYANSHHVAFMLRYIFARINYTLSPLLTFASLKTLLKMSFFLLVVRISFCFCCHSTMFDVDDDDDRRRKRKCKNEKENSGAF